MCRSMIDIQSATAEIRRGKKERKKHDQNIMSASATQGYHKNFALQSTHMQKLPVADENRPYKVQKEFTYYLYLKINECKIVNNNTVPGNVTSIFNLHFPLTSWIEMSDRGQLLATPVNIC